MREKKPHASRRDSFEIRVNGLGARRDAEVVFTGLFAVYGKTVDQSHGKGRKKGQKR